MSGLNQHVMRIRLRRMEPSAFIELLSTIKRRRPVHDNIRGANPGAIAERAIVRRSGTIQMWIVQVALKRPYTFIVLAFLIAIFGSLSAVRTPKDIFPSI